PFARSIASMLIFVVIGVPSAKFQSNYYGIKDAVRWGHPPHQFSQDPRHVPPALRHMVQALGNGWRAQTGPPYALIHHRGC
ncbi:hypothetical protein DQW77_11930, partial [Roseovarius sp. TE539]